MVVKKRKSEPKVPPISISTAQAPTKRRVSIEDTIGDSRLSWVLCILILMIIAFAAQQYAYVTPWTEDYNSDSPFANAVLGYVTPWNGLGYDMAKAHASRFTHISPVWYQISRSGDGYILKGGHDVDQDWIRSVRESSHSRKPLIVPRFTMELASNDDLVKVLQSSTEQAKVAAAITSEIRKQKFDGAVLELWLELPADARRYLHVYLNRLGSALRKSSMQSILVIPPKRGPSTNFDANDFEELRKSFDYFSLMTYDYSSAKAGPNAPLAWMEKSVLNIVPEQDEVKRSQVLMGLNFYGWKFSPGNRPDAVLGTQFKDYLANHTDALKWDQESHEHYLRVSDAQIWYPTMEFLSARTRLARRLGVGIAIWELGQGLDEFYTLI